MGILSGIGALAFIVAALQASPEVTEIAAEPKWRVVPDYPAACRPEPGAAAERQQVTVNFSVTRNGQTENVRVVATTDPCFDETAIAAARTWTYEPRRVDGARRAQEDIEVTITFVWEGETQTEDYDARPILRVPPQYPERCKLGASNTETVLLEFDVTIEGTTENIRVVDSSSRCLERAAEKAAAGWRYQPKTISGTPVVRKNVRTQITFKLSDSSEGKFRRAVANRLDRVRRLLHREGGAQEALERLEAVEAKYGDTFSSLELAAFHRLRAVARIETGDYKGALDDLRIVQRSGMSAEASEAIANMIAQLEAAIAAQEAASAPHGAAAGEAEKAGEPEE